MPLKSLFHEIARHLPEDPPAILDVFAKKKRPRIILGGRKLVFDKKNNRVYYDAVLGLGADGSFKPTEKKAMLRFLLEPNSPPPALAREVVKIVAAMIRQGREISVSWGDGSAKPTLQSGEKTLSLGKHGHGIGRYEGKRFVVMKISEIARWLSGR